MRILLIACPAAEHLAGTSYLRARLDHTGNSGCAFICRGAWMAGDRPNISREFVMITVAHFQPLVALLAGILILIVPRILNYVVALYLIIVGVLGLNAIHHFIRM
jgi:Protein of unknown function (DUF3096)